MSRRSTFTDHAVTYGAIGGTLAPDLMSFPPKGYRPEQHTIRLGSGRERFEQATASLLSWGVQRGAGIEVSDVEEGSGAQYQGVDYGPDGAPVARAQGEKRFGPDGEAFISPGMTAVLHIRAWLRTWAAPILVVYVVDEPDRVGYAYGTLPGHPESGEISFVVDQGEDGSVWFSIRSFSRPSSAFFRLFSGALTMQRRRYTQRYLKALHPAASATLG